MEPLKAETVIQLLFNILIFSPFEISSRPDVIYAHLVKMS